MPITEEQRLERNAKARDAYAKKKEAKEAEAKRASAGSVIRRVASRAVANKKMVNMSKAGSVLASALKRSVANKAYVKEAEQSMLSTKTAGAGKSPPKKSSPKKSSPTQTYEFDKCGVFYKELTLSKEEFMNCNFIPVDNELYNVGGKAREDLLVRIYNQAKGYNKGRFVYRWCSEEQIDSNDAKCISYYEAIQEGIARRQGYSVDWKEGVRQKFKREPLADGYGAYLIIINYGKADKEILLYAQQKQKATLDEKKGQASPPTNSLLKGYGEREIFYATEYHRRKAFNYDNNKVIP